MSRPEEVTWAALKQAASEAILVRILERNQQRLWAKLFIRHIPEQASMDILFRALIYIWKKRKTIRTDQSVDAYLSWLVSTYALEYINKHLLWWYAELDKNELLRPGSKQITINLVFG